MARAKRVRRPKAATSTIYKSGKVALLRLTMPPRSTSGRHVERRHYIVVPITGGTLRRRTYRTVRGQETFEEEKFRLKPFVIYERKPGKGADLEVFNDSVRPVIILKAYPL